MGTITILDISDEATFRLIPPCADPGFDHPSCDYWEDADRGSKAARLDWLEPARVRQASPPPALSDNPFAPASSGPAFNPFARTGGHRPPLNPFADDDDAAIENPFAPKPPAATRMDPTAPRKLGLLGRGLG